MAVSPSPRSFVGSSCQIPVIVSATMLPSASVTPLMLRVTHLWFGGQRSGPADAPLHTGLWLTLVVTLAELLPGFGSVWCAATVAVLTIELPDPAFTVTVKVSVPPGARPAAVQLTTPPTGAQPADAETNVEFAGTGSLTRMPVAVVGPLFVATRVYVTLLPSVVVAGPVLVIDRSGDGTVIVSVSSNAGPAGTPLTRKLTVHEYVPPSADGATVIVSVKWKASPDVPEADGGTTDTCSCGSHVAEVVTVTGSECSPARIASETPLWLTPFSSSPPVAAVIRVACPRPSRLPTLIAITRMFCARRAAVADASVDGPLGSWPGASPNPAMIREEPGRSAKRFAADSRAKRSASGVSQPPAADHVPMPLCTFAVSAVSAVSTLKT